MPDEIDDDELLNLDPSLEEDLRAWATRLDLVAMPSSTQLHGPRFHDNN